MRKAQQEDKLDQELKNLKRAAARIKQRLRALEWKAQSLKRELANVQKEIRKSQNKP